MRLLESRANPNPLEKDRWFSVHLASSVDNTEVAHLILEGAVARMRMLSSKLDGMYLISPGIVSWEFTDRIIELMLEGGMNANAAQDGSGWCTWRHPLGKQRSYDSCLVTVPS